MRDYKPLLTCDSCKRLTRHHNPERREVARMRWKEKSLPPEPTGDKLTAIFWRCADCGAERRYGTVE